MAEFETRYTRTIRQTKRQNYKEVQDPCKTIIIQHKRINTEIFWTTGKDCQGCNQLLSMRFQKTIQFIQRTEIFRQDSHSCTADSFNFNSYTLACEDPVISSTESQSRFTFVQLAFIQNHPYKNSYVQEFIDTRIHPYKSSVIQEFIHTKGHSYKKSSRQIHIHSS